MRLEQAFFGHHVFAEQGGLLPLLAEHVNSFLTGSNCTCIVICLDAQHIPIFLRRYGPATQVRWLQGKVFSFLRTGGAMAMIGSQKQ